MVQGIIGSELAKLIKSAKVPGKGVAALNYKTRSIVNLPSDIDYLIVDVRDEDWKGGNIKGSRNHPSQRFLLDVDDLVKQTQDVPIMIFHCALSQERGPKAARIYEETRNAFHDANHTVYVLQGGFVQFGQSYKDDPELVENWREIIW